MTRENYLLESLQDVDIDWLISVGLKKSVGIDQILIEEGVTTDGLYIVLSGVFSIRLSILGNQSVAQVGPGEVLGEMSYVDGRPPSATVQAAEDAEVLIIPHVGLTHKINTDADFASRFFRGLCVVLADRLRDTLNPNAEHPQATDPNKMANILERLQNA